MTQTRPSRKLSLPVFGGTTREHTGGSLTDQQLASLRTLAGEPGIVFHTHGERALASGKPSPWVVLVSRPGQGPTAVRIETDGTTSR